MMMGGGHFKPAEDQSSYKVLARYPIDQSIAVVKTRLEKGTVILSFVNPEQRSDNYPYDLVQSHSEFSSQLTTAYSKLEESQSFQSECFKQILTEFSSSD